ncbi:MAG: hypothetical protein C4562_00245 [Actinobacteria bacterium]|nr:MAG: hypothetical protein C4562_00245 [Actinomycetota bacterium]
MRKLNRFWFLIPIVIFILTFVVASIFARMGVDPHHDGIMFKPALDVAEGKILFKDTFTQYGALTTILQAFSLSIFGKYLLSLRILTAFFYALTSVILWLIWSKIIPKWLAMLSCIIWIFLAPYFMMTFLPWASVYALFFQMLSLFLLILFIEKEHFLFLSLSGISTALTFLCRQPVGILLSLSIAGFLLVSSKTNFRRSVNKIGVFLAGFSAICVLFFALLIISHSLKDWWLQTIYMPFAWSKSLKDNFFNAGLVGSLFLFKKSSYIWTLLPVINLLVIAITSMGLFIDPLPKKKNLIIMSVCFVSLASWAQYYPIYCERHVYWAATPMIGLFSFVIWNCFVRLKRENQSNITWAVIKSAIVILILILTFWTDIHKRIEVGLIRIEQNSKTVSSPKVLYGQKMTPKEAVSYEKLGKALDKYQRKHPKIKLITNGPDALFLTFLKGNENYQPMYVNWVQNSLIYPNYYRKENKYIKSYQPLIFAPANIAIPLKYYVLESFGAMPEFGIQDYVLLAKTNEG